MKTIGYALVGLFVATVVMLVRSARGAASGAVVPGLPIGDAKRLTPEWNDADFKALADVARKYQIAPADLLLVLASESGLKPQAVARDGSGYPHAVGLNQLTPVANDVVGITEAQRVDLPTWPVSKQIPLIDRMFGSIGWTKAGKPYGNAGVVYAANFAPNRMGDGSVETVLYDRDKDPAAYAGNKGLDTEKKGYITIGDMVSALRRVATKDVYRAGLTRMRAAVGDATLTPGLP